MLTFSHDMGKAFILGGKDLLQPIDLLDFVQNRSNLALRSHHKSTDISTDSLGSGDSMQCRIVHIAILVFDVDER